VSSLIFRIPDQHVVHWTEALLGCQSCEGDSTFANRRKPAISTYRPSDVMHRAVAPKRKSGSSATRGVEVKPAS
jgi:hypothetical protein